MAESALKRSTRSTTPMEVDASLITERRVALGKSIQRLADEVDVTRSYISEIESGKKRPRRAVVERMAKCLGVSLEELVVGPAINVERFQALAGEANDV